MTRFAGTIEELCDVDIAELVAWLLSVPVEDWLKMTDESWCGWGKKFKPLAVDLTEGFYPGCSVSGIGLFMLTPGSLHPAHTDEQPPSWITRVHVPIVTNAHATATMDDGEHRMCVGKAYRFNTLATHAVSNGGKTVRAHFVFDVHGSP